MEKMLRRETWSGPFWKVIGIKQDGRWVSAFGSRLGQYELEYALGKITRARAKTIGIFCFDAQECAIEWKVYLEGYAQNKNLTYRVVQISGRGFGKRPRDTASIMMRNPNIWAMIDDFYSRRDKMPEECTVGNSPLDGTICFHEVQVI